MCWIIAYFFAPEHTLSTDVKSGMQVGDAGGSTKEVPFKAKVRLTLKVPQDNMRNSTVVFHVKKRWDF